MLGKEDLAEANMRKSIDHFLARPADLNLTWAIMVLGMLESWVREGGRIAEADKMKEELDGLIERDTNGKEEAY